jgi:type IV pilus assembly protein PilY1
VGTPLPLFQAKDSLGNPQPITGGISVGVNARKGDANFGKLYVFFGTGQYLLSSDVTDKSVQSWYGLIDTGTQIPDRSVLKQRTITTESTISGSSVRAFSLATAADMVGKRGWYIDLLPPSGAAGERITGDNKFFGSVLLATSIIPSSDICKPGGESFLNAIDPFTGAALTSVFFDVNGDSKFTSADTLTVGGATVPVGSIDTKVNLSSDAILVSGLSGGTSRVIVSGTSGGTATKAVNPLIRTGRIAWREIIRQN